MRHQNVGMNNLLKRIHGMFVRTKTISCDIGIKTITMDKLKISPEAGS